MSIFFTSDNHFYHAAVIGYSNRPYKYVQEMNEDMINKWNSIVTNNDIIFHLGDFSMNKWAVSQIMPRLNGNIVLVSGNHDHCFKGRPNKVKQYLEWGFGEVFTKGQHPVIELEPGLPVRLSHIPYENQDERFIETNPVDDGIILLHGHTHSKPENRIRYSKKGTLMLNLGVDAWSYSPVSKKQVIELIKENLQ